MWIKSKHVGAPNTREFDKSKSKWIFSRFISLFCRFMPAFLRLGSWNIVMFMSYEQLKRAFVRFQQSRDSALWQLVCCCRCAVCIVLPLLIQTFSPSQGIHFPCYRNSTSEQTCMDYECWIVTDVGHITRIDLAMFLLCFLNWPFSLGASLACHKMYRWNKQWLNSI